MAAHTEFGRKRVTTYGKAARKRLPGYEPASPYARPTATSHEGASPSNSIITSPHISSPESATSASTPPRLVSTPKRSRSADIFDVPSSDEEPAPEYKVTTKKKATPSFNNVARIARFPQNNSAVDIANREKRRKLQNGDRTTPLETQRLPPPRAPIHRSLSSISPKKAGAPLQHPLLNSPSPRKPASTLAPKATVKSKPTPKKTSAAMLGLSAQPKQLSRPHDSKSTAETFEPRAGNAPSTSVKLPSHAQPSKPKGPGVKPHSGDVPKRATMPVVPVFTNGRSQAIERQNKNTSSQVSEWDFVISDEDSNEPQISSVKKTSQPVPVLGPAPVQARQSSTIQERSIRPQTGRRRLIDSFAEKRRRSIDSLSSSDDGEPSQFILPEHNMESVIPTELPTPTHDEYLQQLNITSETVNDAASAQIKGARVTYGRQRSMLAEQNFDLNTPLLPDMNSLDPPDQATSRRKARRVSISTIKPLPSFSAKEEGLSDAEGEVILSRHELRQAGAQRRFVDGVEHLLDDIGKPGATRVSQRRSGLLQVANNLLEKDYRVQFINNGFEQQLFVQLGHETDIISGFILASTLIVCIYDGLRSHTVQQLLEQGFAKLLIREIDHTASIVTIAKERNSNMSKFGQSALVDYQTALLQMPIWEESKPSSTSPRTIALKCLELMVRKSREAGVAEDVISKDLVGKLFSVLDTAKEDSSFPSLNSKALDFKLALSTLESHSIRATTSHNEGTWITEYLPTTSKVLGRLLARSEKDLNFNQLLALRLTLNVTNNNAKACDCFSNPTLISLLAQIIARQFKRLSGFLAEEEREMTVEHLILALGVMINFAEWSGAIRNCIQDLEGTSEDPLEELIRIFLENQERTSEVSLQDYDLYSKMAY
jgi:hypothetical protein